MVQFYNWTCDHQHHVAVIKQDSAAMLAALWGYAERLNANMLTITTWPWYSVHQEHVDYSGSQEMSVIQTAQLQA